MSHFRDRLRPQPPREFRGQRWLNIGLRSAHLLGTAGIAGGFLFALEESRWLMFWYLTLGSGLALSLLYVWSTAAWLLQLKGLTIMFKILLLAAALHWPTARAELFIMIILLSGFIAHAPGVVRGWGVRR